MKSIWKGNITFGLVSIPIQLYSVAQEHVLGFKMLCQTCHHPISLRRWCNHCNKEVPWESLVKGLEIKKDEFLVLTKEAIKSLKPTKTTTVAITSFITPDLIDPVYFNTHYYAAPEKTNKAYTLFHYALGATNKVALGSFVMRDREHVCIIQSYREGLLMTTLYYDYEIRPVEKLAVYHEKQPSIMANELKLAKQLISQLTRDTFDIHEFKDTFAQDLKKLIKQHATGKGKKSKITLKIPSKKSLHPSLAESLKASLQAAPKRKR